MRAGKKNGMRHSNAIQAVSPNIPEQPDIEPGPRRVPPGPGMPPGTPPETPQAPVEEPPFAPPPGGPPSAPPPGPVTF